MSKQKKINWWWIVGGVILIVIVLWIVFSSGSVPPSVDGNISPPPALPS